jgi:hypothetical protein
MVQILLTSSIMARLPLRVLLQPQKCSTWQCYIVLLQSWHTVCALDTLIVLCKGINVWVAAVLSSGPDDHHECHGAFLADAWDAFLDTVVLFISTVSVLGGLDLTAWAVWQLGSNLTRSFGLKSLERPSGHASCAVAGWASLSGHVCSLHTNLTCQPLSHKLVRILLHHSSCKYLQATHSIQFPGATNPVVGGTYNRPGTAVDSHLAGPSEASHQQANSRLHVIPRLLQRPHCLLSAEAHSHQGTDRLS